MRSLIGYDFENAIEVRVGNTPPEQRYDENGPERPRAARLAAPARLLRLASVVQHRPDALGIVGRACQLEAALQAALSALRAPEPAAGAREAIAAELVRLRRELDALVPPAVTTPPDEAPRAARERMANLLGVPLAAPFDAVIDAKLGEQQEQLLAFDHVATKFGFERANGLGADEARGALVLTANASIVQLSATGAGGEPRARRYVYQGIYGAAVPSEGTLVLAAGLRLGEPLRSSVMCTSPICDLRLPRGVGSWERERTLSFTLDRIIHGEQPAPRRRQETTRWDRASGYVPSVVFAPPPSRRSDTARAELRRAIADLARDRGEGPDPVREAEVIGLCIYLQGLAVERGGQAVTLDAALAFAGASQTSCSLETLRGRRVLTIERPGEASLEVLDVTIGAQCLVVGAPLALLDGAGAIVALVGDIHHIDGT